MLILKMRTQPFSFNHHETERKYISGTEMLTKSESSSPKIPSFKFGGYAPTTKQPIIKPKINHPSAGIDSASITRRGLSRIPFLISAVFRILLVGYQKNGMTFFPVVVREGNFGTADGDGEVGGLAAFLEFQFGFFGHGR